MLLTGFQGYGGRGINPAERIVRALDGQAVGDETIEGHVLPVAYEALAARISSLVGERAPRAVICLGLWPGEALIRLERIAVNLNDFEIADNEGRVIEGPIEDNAPLALAASLPVKRIRTRLLEAGIPARLSSSAGNFLCNATMFRALQAVTDRNPRARCGFIHVPYLPEQVADMIRELHDTRRLELHQRGDLSSMSLETMVRAIRIAIETTLEET